MTGAARARRSRCASRRCTARASLRCGASRKGTRVIEYLGERVSHPEADRRYETKDATDNHTFLFIVDRRIVIDAGVDGNDARFINHGCDPNCESVVEDRRVFIEADAHDPAGRRAHLRLSDRARGR